MTHAVEGKNIYGVTVATMVAQGPIPTNALPLRIGADSSGGSRFRGTIDEPRVYGRALTAGEIFALYRETNCQ